jgi:DNA repair exonuclease SbcCD ATPase subunit
MKNKIVIWGTNELNEKVLIALELQADTNKVVLYSFPESIASDDFVNKMMSEWRNGSEVAFPEGYFKLERELTVTDSLLPENLKVERTDLIQRAQTEWHFVVLSSKLHAAYQQELADFKEKIQGLQKYDHGMWDSLRTFWDKVQGQSRERNLFREHADNLRDNINVLFEDLKKMRSKVQDEFASSSQKVYEDLNKSLEDIEARIAAGGAKISNIFDELKQMQRKYRDAKMNNEHRNQIWERLDGAFKKAKERKFGPAANEGSVVERHERRLSGLLEAIKRMEDSIRRDEEELNFQRKKVDATEGQLEAQIRMAKIKMVEERLSSKRDKLTEMTNTRTDVERQANNAKSKEAKRAEKEADRQKLAVAKEQVRSEIAAGIKNKSDQPAEHEESLFEAAGTVLGDVLVDALDSLKAVASVAADKADEAFDQVKTKAGKMAAEAANAISQKLDEMKEARENPEEPAKAEEMPAPVVETPAEEPPAEKPKKAPKKKAE